MKDRSKLIEDIENIINGKNVEKDPFKCGVEEFGNTLKNMDWNELRKLATSVNISVNRKRREELVANLCVVYGERNGRRRPRP